MAGLLASGFRAGAAGAGADIAGGAVSAAGAPSAGAPSGGVLADSTSKPSSFPVAGTAGLFSKVGASLAESPASSSRTCAAPEPEGADIAGGTVPGPSAGTDSSATGSRLSAGLAGTADLDGLAAAAGGAANGSATSAVFIESPAGFSLAGFLSKGFLSATGVVAGSGSSVGSGLDGGACRGDVGASPSPSSSRGLAGIFCGGLSAGFPAGVVDSAAGSRPSSSSTPAVLGSDCPWGSSSPPSGVAVFNGVAAGAESKSGIGRGVLSAAGCVALARGISRLGVGPPNGSALASSWSSKGSFRGGSGSESASSSSGVGGIGFDVVADLSSAAGLSPATVGVSPSVAELSGARGGRSAAATSAAGCCR